MDRVTLNTDCEQSDAEKLDHLGSALIFKSSQIVGGTQSTVLCLMIFPAGVGGVEQLSCK